MLSSTAVTAKANSTTAHTPDRLHGSLHWDIERAASVALVPLIASQLAFGASPVTDTLLGVVLPLHLHIGFGACITDYFNTRKTPILNKLMTATLYASTAGVLVGCYQFNTNDVGLTEFISRTWTA
ncbi:succinate dehydrogenase flavo protein subunit 4 SDH4 [Phycomyces blakesleeanus NRRL 1555(-)]|uniref:Succinate dehydrogenase [ubiquinone] cytochrome b small subunit n=1 Tax=Phycomyces blakesleeanus (strain ATCC 8743b / DSM 1359 / FGSC 10004 / NBRC 33097 / NRRL 1555) TaxID=763407 RepID=A0A167L054_PHYB8|nr:succinate dehydrogenase flavo protein subunit 4 SDH4 [Phycomyces blakesleeanus NRRL 1555(-)]OAD69286.1 succinate dehydrogenase flavo protein subunit 4 SDH4 [Phycomyces blakesleeanus NRRL 1555(-)]|eukprot:XP_018287326.1 succinate dehydrogenase flavo protein subunit 4 SDH4 [Phycomyces blakesleeanus NRRL 1555(-)]